MVAKYLSFIKFSHTVFALPFALVGFVLGLQASGGHFLLEKLIWVLGCMVFARSAAMGFNRYIDRAIDAQNARTAIREIPSGQISPQAALGFVVLTALAFVACAAMINPLCFYLSPVALAVILGYSYTKRFTALCHVVLGVGLGLAPVGAYLAVTEHFSLAPVLLGFAVMSWVSGFDVIYALQDEQFDRSLGLQSLPARFGGAKALLLARLLHSLSATLMVSFGLLTHAGILYWIGAGVFISMLIYQHRIVSPSDLSRVNAAFFTTNGIASVVVGTFTIVDILLRK